MMTKKHLHTLADQEDREKYRMVRVSPTLYRALSDLAADEDLRLSTLVALLINAGLDYRNAQRRLDGGPR
jgi:hypothetical protein